MGGSDGDTQYKMSSNPPDTETCNGILFTLKHGQASQRLSVFTFFFTAWTMTLKKIVCLISQQKKSAYIFFLLYYLFFFFQLREHPKVISDKGKI